MTREELKEHCERQIEMCEFWAIGKGEEPSGKVYEEHKLILELLEQEPCEDAMAIHMQGLDEGIRCSMCTNSMKNDRGCDGGCVVDEYMYREVMNTIENHIVPSVTPARKIGYWIEEYIGCMYDVCSECGQKVTTGHFKYNYCPNCGAKMESEVDE